MERKCEKDAYFLNEAMQLKRREHEKFVKVYPHSRIPQYFKLADAKNEIPPFLRGALKEGEDKNLREKVRTFLGSNY